MGLMGLMGRIAGRFARAEHRRGAARLVLGPLADLPRKNCWTTGEWAALAAFVRGASTLPAWPAVRVVRHSRRL